MIAQVIREQVQRACEREENIFGPAFFDQHLAVVAECAARLAQRLGGDSEVVELAAYLHDFSAVLDPATLLNHTQASADVARGLLAAQDYPAEAIERVAKCITSHQSPRRLGDASVEEVCISNADAMSRLERPAYWLYFAFRVHRLGFEEGRRWLLKLIESEWNAMVEPAKELVADRYAAAREMLRP